MPRSRRSLLGGVCIHVVARANARAVVFHDSEDYGGFLRLVEESCRRVPVTILGWCLMPNHFHLVVWPRNDLDLGRYMHWLLSVHVLHNRTRYGTVGHVWQGRYKVFPIQTDRHLVTVLRYVERNPVRAGLAHRCTAWPWSSARARVTGDGSLLAPSPVSLPEPWADCVDAPLTATELARVRESVGRGRPFGGDTWSRDTSDRLNLAATLNPRGRPRTSAAPRSFSSEPDER